MDQYGWHNISGHVTLSLGPVLTVMDRLPWFIRSNYKYIDVQSMNIATLAGNLRLDIPVT
jgi:hypothetical protein